MMKKLLNILILLSISVFSYSQRNEDIKNWQIARIGIKVGDSTVTKIMEDTLINTVYVKNKIAEYAAGDTTGGGVSGDTMTWPSTPGIAVYSGSSTWGTSLTDNHLNWDAGYTNRLVSASGTSPLSLTLNSNALTGSINILDGSGTTYNTNKIDLGGIITDDVSLTNEDGDAFDITYSAGIYSTTFNQAAAAVTLSATNSTLTSEVSLNNFGLAYTDDYSALNTSNPRFIPDKGTVAGMIADSIAGLNFLLGESVLFLHSEASDIAGYNELSTTVQDDPQTTNTAVVNSGSGAVAIQEFITDSLLLQVLPGGVWNPMIFASVDNATGVTTITMNFYNRTAGGTETLLFSLTTPEINNTTVAEIDLETVQSDFALNRTDRLIIKFTAATTSVGDRTVTLYYEGSANYSHIHSPIVIGISGGGSGISQIDSTTSVVNLMRRANPDKVVVWDSLNQRFKYENTVEINLGNSYNAISAGTNYTLTETSALLDFATTDPSITILEAGTYEIQCGVFTVTSGATFASVRTLDYKIRRTNNTAQDVAYFGTINVPIMTTLTTNVGSNPIAIFTYTTTNDDDVLQLWGNVSNLPTAGSIQTSYAWIRARRIK